MKWLQRFLWIGGLLLIFVAGLVVGSAGTLRFVQKRYEERMNPQSWEPRTLAWLRTDLQLSPEQETQVRPSVDQAVTELVSLRGNADKERRAILGRLLVEVAQHLTPAQRDRLQTMLQDKERQRNTSSP